MARSPPAPPHPYYPVEINLIGYLANEHAFDRLLLGFFSTWGVILVTTLILVRKYCPSLGIKDTTCILWFVLTGTIHFFFEGYFSVNHATMAAKQDLFGQLWKEYAHADSRYLTSDPFVLCMETITAVFWGPLSFLCVWLIATDSPYRYPAQAIVSLGQIYGDVLYYMTNYFDLVYRGLSYSRPEALYFWFYYVFLNAIWIAVPGLLLASSIKHTAQAFRVSKAAVSTNGVAKAGKK